MTRNGHTKDLTEGRPLKQILIFALPMIIGGIIQQLYSVVDTLIVGNTLGSQALAAVGATGSTMFFMISFMIGLTNAFSIVTSHYFGAKNEQMVKKTVVNAIFLSAICAVLLTLVGIYGARPLMELLQTPSEIINQSTIYIQICIGFCAAQLAYNVAAALLRAIGDSKTPLYFLMISALANIALDLVFILVFHMDVAGAAVATVISQAISATLCIVHIIRKFPIFHIKRQEFRPDFKQLVLVSKMGLTMGLQSCLISLGEMAVTGVINGFGTTVVAAYTAGVRVEEFATLAFINLSQAFSIYAGQNLGARKTARVQEGFKKLAVVIILLSFVSMILIFNFGDDITRWFIADSDAEINNVVNIAYQYLCVSACFYPFLGMILLYNNTLRGIGELSVPLMSGIIELFSKVGFSIILSSLFSYTGIWYAAPLGWMLGMIPSLIRYHQGNWKRRPNKITAEIQPEG